MSRLLPGFQLENVRDIEIELKYINEKEPVL